MKKMTHVLIISNMLLMFSCISCNLAAGSYPYAEQYNIKNSEFNLVVAINKFKEANPEYKVPVQTQLKDGRRNENDHWYHVYFYYKQENEIVKTWVRSTGSETTFAFVGLNVGLTLGNWKEINKDYSKKENKLQKEKFERLILNEIKKQLK